MAHKRSRKAFKRRKEKKEIRDAFYSLQWKNVRHDWWLGEKVWTDDTTQAVYEGLQSQFGHCPQHFLEMQNPPMTKHGLVVSQARKFLMIWLARGVTH